MNQDIREFVNSYKYEISNYYLSENDVIDLIQKYLLRYLEGILSQCLNVSEGRCDIWYLDSHRECQMLMSEIDKIKAGI